MNAEIELKEKLAQLETQVAVVKDPNLRQIAFAKLMETLIAPSQAARPTPPIRTSGSSPTPSQQRSKTKNKAADFYALAQVRDEVQKLAITGTSKGLPNFRDCKKAWEGMLWVLASAKPSGLEGLNNHEIAYLLTKRLYKPTKYTTVNNIRNQVGAGLVFLDPESQCWMITPDGEAHLNKVSAK